MNKLFALLLAVVLNRIVPAACAADRPDFLVDAEFDL